MAKQRFDLVDSIPDDAQGYTEFRPKGRVRMGSYVTWPAFAFGFMSFIAVMGIISVVALVLNELNHTPPTNAWIGAILFALAIGSIVGAYVFWVQLEDYRNLQYIERHYVRSEPEPEHIERLVEKDPDNDYLYKVGSIKWREGALDKLAKRLYTDDGAWKGEDKVVRRVMAGLIVNETERFPNVLEEFAHVGWIDNVENKLWTQRGKDAMRLRWDKLNSPHPK